MEIASAASRKADTLKANTVFETERKVKDVYFMVFLQEEPFFAVDMYKHLSNSINLSKQLNLTITTVGFLLAKTLT